MTGVAGRVAALSLVLFVAGCADVSPNDLVAATWVREDGGAARIDFARSGRFSASGLPPTHFCTVDGSGRWEYDEDGNRVFLHFDVMSGGACNAPYLTTLFRRHGRGLLAFESVDEPGTAIRFVHRP